MGSLLVIDGGRSHCRVAVIGPDGVREAAGEGRGLPTGEGIPALAQAVGEAVALCSVNPETIDALSAGLAGMLAAAGHAPELAERLARLLGVERVVLTGDVVTAYAGALGPVAGVVVVAGTGAVALGVSADAPGAPGHWVRTDGWGHLLGDAGSGYWIGRRGLEEALRAHDGRAGSAVLAGLAENHLGPLDTIPSRVAAAPSPAAAIAAFAPHVADAARRGDTGARVIWTEAASELATSAAACTRRLFPPGPPVPISWSGGLFGAEDLLLGPFLERLSELVPDAIPTPPAGDALDGAAALAGAVPDRHGDTPNPGLLARFVYDSAAASPVPTDAETPSAVLT
jgi:N-acetylglucosamine kinase-like BadF-type ATPase